ncbi:hypothetical protein FS837_003407 [Tulasnella sp. UAMH 9824]|nr:hypothetical protein FS837_003407 [Tulasnella sp. UAMH 9824]
MDSIPYCPNWPKFGLRRIPNDIMIYILDFLESTALAAMALANRHLNELITPTLYRTITIPGGGNHGISHQISAARLIRTLMHRPSLTVLVRHLENAPPVIPSYLLRSICSGRLTLSYSGPAFAQQDGHADSQPYGLPMDVMKSCVNLRSLTVAGLVTSHPLRETDKWLNFLLDPRIKLKRLKLLAYAQHNIIKTTWNRFVAQILDVQRSLEYLEYPFDNKYPEIERESIDKWVPELRVLCGDDVRGFKALLSRNRPIETVVVRGIPMKDIRRSFGPQLTSVDTIEELVYEGPQVDSLNFADLFETVPALKIFSGEVWLSVVDPLEDLFLQVGIFPLAL